MTDVQDYNSRLSDPESRKFETFSYLPQFDDAAVRAQDGVAVHPFGI